MKKVYLLAGALATGLAATAQIMPTNLPAKKSRESLGYVNKKVNATATEKAEGDVLWGDDFTTASNWTISNAGAAGTPPHTAGDWAIVNAMPSSLTSQAASYGFPSAMLSTSGGNFALVDSDGAGASATQNAYLTTASGIDVAAALTTAGSPLNTPLYLKFKEIYRHYYDENYIQVSNDGGTTWTEIQVNPVSQVPVNTNSGNPETEIVNITSAIGAGNWSSDVRIRFRYQGAYDWFWGIDDVELVEAWNNDLRVNNWYQATDVATTQGLDYYFVNQTQASFPGLTFGAWVENNGSNAQPDVALNVTAPTLSYDETGTAIAIASGSVDSVSISVPLMLTAAVADHTVNITTSMANTDSDVANNEASFVLHRDAYLYSRDDGNRTGAISQVSSQDALPLKIGNVMEIFDPMDITMISIRLINQSAAVGQQIFGEIYVWDSGAGDWTFMAETQPYTIVNADLDNFVSLPLDGGALTVAAGDAILVVAGHFGGSTEVGFGYAQPTFEGTVQGFTNDGNGFNLTTPNAIMVRVSDQGLALDENTADFSVNVFPNPAVNEAKVSFELTNAADVVVTVTDLSGKVVYTNNLGNTAAGTHNVEINTAQLAGGVYAVNFNADNATVTQKLVIKK